jgi:hypothetical protein
LVCTAPRSRSTECASCDITLNIWHGNGGGLRQLASSRIVAAISIVSATATTSTTPFPILA